MTITVSVPEELTRQAHAAGLSVEAYVEQLMQQAAHPPLDEYERPTRTAEAKNLVELFAPVRGLLTDEEVDTLFTRNRSPGRPLDLS